MNIAKALKLKNRLAGEVAKLKAIVQTKNVRELGQEQVYDVKGIVEITLPDAILKLVKVKTAIACANALADMGTEKGLIERYPYWAIFMIAETKGMIETLRAMDTKNGMHTEFRVLRETPSVVEYVASLKQKEVDDIVAKLESNIDSLQDRLDARNGSCELPVLDGITVR